MAIIRYACRIVHRPPCGARVSFNGIPFYESTPDKIVGRTSPVSHTFVPGENRIAIEIWPAPKLLEAPSLESRIQVMILTLDDEKPIWNWEYPFSPREAGLEPTLPWAHADVFTPSGEIPEPVYFRATPEEFPREGTDEQRAAVDELRSSFEAKDFPRFSDAMALRQHEWGRYYGKDFDPTGPARAREALKEPWNVDPLAPEDLLFERYENGRVARVRRISGRPAIHAQHAVTPQLEWGSDIFITRVDGRWQMFR